MAAEVPEEDYRQLSELQHFVFCRRQWALIHVEQQWAENIRTVEGMLMHERVHDESKTELRGNLLIVRGLRVKSDKLRAAGICDVVEFRRDDNGIMLQGRAGKWVPRPVEYKRGKPKEDHSDELQLCGQAMCLEEMLCCEIPEGDLFYWEPHRRSTVVFTQQLRKQAADAFAEMNELYRRGYTPRSKKSKACGSCSLKEICLPEMGKAGSAAAYMQEHAEILSGGIK